MGVTRTVQVLFHISETPEVVAIYQLHDDGTVTAEGRDHFLEEGVYIPGENQPPVMPSAGSAFMDALLTLNRNASSYSYEEIPASALSDWGER